MRVTPIRPIAALARFPARRRPTSFNLNHGVEPMKIHPSITVDRIMEACEADDHLGFCIRCGDDAYGVEPDARRYTCESCDEPGVYGAEELLLMTA
jgi:hypothetical protein